MKADERGPKRRRMAPIRVHLRSAAAAACLVALAVAAAPQPSRAEAGGGPVQGAAALFDAGDYEGGLAAAREALAAARATGDTCAEAWALDYVGNGEFWRGDYESALESFTAAVDRMRACGDRCGEGHALRDAGVAYRYLRRYDEALDRFYESLDVMRASGARADSVSVLLNIGTVHAAFGDHEQAMRVYAESLRVASEEGADREIQHAYERMAWLAMSARRPEQALDQFGRSLEIARRRGHLHGEASALEGSSSALAALGRRDEAIAATTAALRIHERLGVANSIAYNISWLGHYHVDSEPALALDYFRRAREASDRPYDRLLWEVEAGTARAHRRLGDLDAAVAHFERVLDGLERVRGGISSDERRAAFLVRNHGVYRELIETLMERYERGGEEDAARAFEVLERVRARSMLDAIAEASLDDAAGPELRRRREELDGEIAALQGRLADPSLGDAERRDALAALEAAEGGFERLVAEARRADPRRAALRYPAPLAASRAAELLDGSTALVAYALADSSAFAFVVTRDGLRAERLAARPAEIAARVENLVDLVARDDAAWRRIARRLEADLIAPVRPHLGAGVERLVVLPDGVLHRLPFEALTTEGGDGRGRFLVEEFDVSYAPSATVLAALGGGDPAPGAVPADMLVFGDPVPGAAAPGVGRALQSLYDGEGLDLAAIPSSAVEAAAVASFGGRGSALFTGREASERRAKRGDLERFGVLHFATHGLVSERSPSRSALVLASDGGEDGLLQAREICHLRLACDLVVLSACQTARGRVLMGEGVQGLTRAFLLAGARSVVASLWDVGDDETARFMEAFYGHLARGAAKSAALRAAKLELIARDPARSPRVWAPFVLVGEASRPVALDARGAARGGAPIWGWLPLAGAAAAAAAWSLQRRRRSR